jgi:NADH-quinone oxidoreductase subunit J
MTLSDILFYLLALLAIAGGAGVAFSKNVVYSAFSLLAALFAVAGIYIFVSADLLAVVQVLVYIGGILVLILFAIMLTNKIGDARGTNLGINFGAASVVFALMICMTVLIAVTTPWGQFVGDGLPVL